GSPLDASPNSPRSLRMSQPTPGFGPAQQPASMAPTSPLVQDAQRPTRRLVSDEPASARRRLVTNSKAAVVLSACALLAPGATTPKPGPDASRVAGPATAALE